MSETSAETGDELTTPEEQFHTGASIKVATVAALGGFLFGYDSAVINGAVSAIGEVFNVESGPLGFAVVGKPEGRRATQDGRRRGWSYRPEASVLPANGCL